MHPGDFTFLFQELFIKKTGEFFLYGEGGAISKYAVSAGLNWWSGEKEIVPLTWDDAKEWAEENLSADKYMEIFGEVEE